MAYGVTPDGFITKPHNKILESLSNKAKAEWGEDTPTTPDSVFGQFFNIISSVAKDGWDVTQASADQQNRETAEGVYLDYLARIAGLTRLAESGSVGNLLFSGNAGTTVQPFTVCRDQAGRNVLTREEVTLNRAGCYTSTFVVANVTDNTDYTLVVEGTTITIDSGTSASVLSILTALQGSITSNTNILATLADEVLLLTFPSFNNGLATTNSDNLLLQLVGNLTVAESAIVGSKVNFTENTVTTLVSANLNIDSVTNPAAFQNGRDTETDEELRLRMSDREESAGTATKPSIEASLSEVVGVTSAFVVRNNTLIDDPVTGLAAKSFETYVGGGADTDIAETLWRTAPLFGQYHGTESVIIVDENGDNQTIRFSRPSSSFAHVRVVYSLDLESQAPADAELAMREAVTTFGNKQAEGVDLEPTKFYGPLYTVEGVYISSIQVAVTDTVNGVPTFQSSKISVSEAEGLLFDTSRVVITT